jgi:hypothetical protein
LRDAVRYWPAATTGIESARHCRGSRLDPRDQVVRAHDGILTVISQRTTGNKFTVRLPLSPPLHRLEIDQG